MNLDIERLLNLELDLLLGDLFLDPLDSDSDLLLGEPLDTDLLLSCLTSLLDAVACLPWFDPLAPLAASSAAEPASSSSALCRYQHLLPK